MARIFKDSSVLNQFGSPSINSNTIANRPSYGQTGRLFVSTDTLSIYRDTGNSWALIGGSGASQNLEQVTTVGNTTTKGIFAGASGSLTAGFLLEVLGRTKLTATSGNTVYIGLPNISPNAATFDVFGYSSFRLFTDSASNIGSIMRNDFLINLSANITTGDPSASINQLTLNTVSNSNLGNATAGQMYIGAGLNKNIINDDGTTANVITLVQSSGIFALSALQSISEYSGLGGTTISHYAGIVINGIKSTNGSQLTITNNYQLLINSSQQFSGSTTVTNRWGIYQAGANDNNYFASKVLIGSTVDNGTGAKLQILGETAFSISSTTNSVNLYMFTNNGSNQAAIESGGGSLSFRTGGLYTQNFIITSTGNVLIGTTSSSGRKLVVNGQQEWLTTVGTGSYTTSGNHLPVWVNGVQYWLALLNPPALP